MTTMTIAMQRAPTVALTVAGLIILGACDTSVTNPGPTADEFLDAPVAQAAVLTGAKRALSDALNTDSGAFTLYWSAALAFEINPAGSTGSFGITPRIQVGTMDENDSDGPWDSANEARFVAEDGYDRFTDPERAGGTATDAVRAELALLAGYANRLLGETFCEAVLPVQDAGKQYPAALTSGPVEERAGSVSAHTDYLTRAEQWFTLALNLGTGAIDTAATAGRASVRAALANWSDAAADAASVANTFKYQARFSDQDQGQFNALVWANGDSPYRAHTQWGTFSEWYSQTFTNDPRMEVMITTRTGDAAVTKFGGQVPWHPQQKYTDVDEPVNLSSGWEMRLVEAEAALVNGQVAAAVGLMNQRRNDLSLATFDPGVSADSAWALLKLERQVELWLEARRLGDLRRWSVSGAPGALRDGLYSDTDGDGVTEDTIVETLTSPVARSLCYPIGIGEKETNPNVG